MQVQINIPVHVLSVIFDIYFNFMHLHDINYTSTNQYTGTCTNFQYLLIWYLFLLYDGH